ncbi:hypothetical protein KAK06_14875 [Ideonella sp. 4Y11]|uniref:DUF6249 domain-containing protein n=1 Tax=Ideonella aquatica TaxID=2824119 RepID=A0A941BGV6_9BURK|nr:DUF6249 domain-containing protein [Ideonella aquatica]MBQ0960236.1 hypothetical protein [Ideonella aquatica]
MDAEALLLKQLLGLLIPICGIVGGVAVALLWLGTEHKRRSQLLEQSHRERMLAIERGLPVPPLPQELFDPEDRVDPLDVRSRALRRGLTFVLGGLAVSAALAINRDIDTAAWGLIPIAIGIANLIFVRLGPTMAKPD